MSPTLGDAYPLFIFFLLFLPYELNELWGVTRYEAGSVATNIHKIEFRHVGVLGLFLGPIWVKYMDLGVLGKLIQFDRYKNEGLISLLIIHLDKNATAIAL